MACIFAFPGRSVPKLAVCHSEVGIIGELLAGDGFSSMDFVEHVTWGWLAGVSSGAGSAVPMSAEDGRPKQGAVVPGVRERREKTPAS